MSKSHSSTCDNNYFIFHIFRGFYKIRLFSIYPYCYENNQSHLLLVERAYFPPPEKTRPIAPNMNSAAALMAQAPDAANKNISSRCTIQTAVAIVNASISAAILVLKPIINNNGATISPT